MPSNSLEQEAMDRVARMYSSFERGPRERRQPRMDPRPSPRPEPPQELPKEEKPPEPREGQGRGLLEMLMQDKEQSLILLLLVILMKEGADMNLLLALVYMLL